MNLTRRSLIASAALLPVACGIPLSYENGIPVAAPNPLPTIRPPQVGQEWTYIKRNTFNGKTIGNMTERVTSVGSVIKIESTSEGGAQLPSEIQQPWGMVVTDPNWSKILNFSPAIPLWPQQLSVRWSKQIASKYTIAGYPDSNLNWQEYMTVQGWEKITVPAGVFIALRYQSLINYESEDANKVDCVHKETAWFAPQIGRWVAREISGSYRIQGQINNENMEDRFQWQLTSYK
jgi:hypothetical protein